MTGSSAITRGDIWEINFDPQTGSEISKKRPAVIISSDAVGILPLKLVAPITEWNTAFSGTIWRIRIGPDLQNSLTKLSAIDVLQIRSVDIKRFVRPMGRVSPHVLEEIVAALVIKKGYRGLA